MEAEVSQAISDLEWWEIAFGKGTVFGWSYRHTCSILFTKGGQMHQMNAQDRAFFMTYRGGPEL